MEVFLFLGNVGGTLTNHRLSSFKGSFILDWRSETQRNKTNLVECLKLNCLIVPTTTVTVDTVILSITNICNMQIMHPHKHTHTFYKLNSSLHLIWFDWWFMSFSINCYSRLNFCFHTHPVFSLPASLFWKFYLSVIVRIFHC